MRGRDLGLLIGLIVVVLLVVVLLGGGMMGFGLVGPGMMGRFGGYGFAPWWGLGMGIGMLLFWVLVIAGGVGLIASLSRRDRWDRGIGPQRPSPIDILKERYARGEITREQYEEMRHDLEAS